MKAQKYDRLFPHMIVRCTILFIGLMKGLNLVGNKSKHIKKKFMSIHEIESEADCLFRKTVLELFKNETDVF